MDRSHFLCLSWSVSDTRYSETMDLDILKVGCCKAADMVVSFDRPCWVQGASCRTRKAEVLPLRG